MQDRRHLQVVDAGHSKEVLNVSKLAQLDFNPIAKHLSK